MVKLVTLFTHPDEPSDFDRRFFHEHLPLARAIPGLLRIEVWRASGTSLGDPPYYVVEELHFADRPSLDAGLASGAGRRADQALRFAAGLGTVLIVDEAEAARPI